MIHVTKDNNLLQEAFKLHQAGNLAEAASIYHRVLELQPEHVDACFLLGTLSLQQGDLDSAAMLLKKTISLKPDHVAAFNNLGTVLQEQGFFDEAAVIYNNAIELKPDDADAHYNLGNVLRRGNKLDEAVRSYRQSIVFNPNDEVYYNLGNVLKEQDKLDDAAECYRQVIKIRPEHAAAYNNLGTVLQEQGKLEEAVENYRNAIKLKPDNAMTHYNMGTTMQKQGRFEEAVSCYQRTLDLNPDYAEAHINLGNVLKDLGRLDEAASCYQKALELNPAYAEVHNNLGSVFKELRKLDKAVASYRQAIALNPDFAEAHNNLGAAFHEQNKPDEAETSFRQAILLDQEYPEPHTNLGTVLKEQGRIDEAVTSYNRAIALKPDFVEAHYNLGILFQEQDKIDEAIKHLKRTLKINPGYVNAIANLADLCERKNCLDDAQSYIEKGLKLVPNNPFLNLIAAKLERRQDRHQDAINRLESIENAGRFNVRIQYLLGQLKDKIGNNSEAFEHFITGNRLHSEQFSLQNVDKNTYLREINRMIEYFEQDVVSTWTANPAPEFEETPVFIIGFPRSGTTLLDQILDSHPRLQTLEEKPIISTLMYLINKLPNGFPNALSNLTQEQVKQLRNRYVQTASEYLQRQSGTILIDKLPLNTSLIPLIWRIFPKAKIILSLRHPCDVCLSCFMQNFEVNEAMANFLTLEDTANLYVKVMGLWKRYVDILPLNYHIVRYEDLIENFELETRKILDFLDVEWDDKVIRYKDHARKRDRIATPSYYQVTNPSINMPSIDGRSMLTR